MVGFEQTITILKELDIIENKIFAIEKGIKHLKNPLSKIPLKKIIPISLALVTVFMMFKAPNFIGVLFYVSLFAGLWVILYIVCGQNAKKEEVKRQIEQFEHKKNDLINRYNDLVEALNDSIVPKEYRILGVVEQLYQYVTSGQAENIKEAIYMYEITCMGNRIDQQERIICSLKSEIKDIRKENENIRRDVNTANSRASSAALMSLFNRK